MAEELLEKQKEETQAQIDGCKLELKGILDTLSGLKAQLWAAALHPRSLAAARGPRHAPARRARPLAYSPSPRPTPGTAASAAISTSRRRRRPHDRIVLGVLR